MAEVISTTTCKYKNKTTGWQCPRPALPDSKDGFCICHEQKDDKDEALFRKEIDEIVGKAGEEDCHFEGFYFSYDMDFSRINFKLCCYFDCAVFKQNVRFDNAQFSGELTKFWRTQFSGEKTTLWNVHFSSKETHFGEAQFMGEITSLLGVHFKGEITNFTSAQFAGKYTTFFGSQYYAITTSFLFANFSGEKIDFSGLYIATELDFSEVRFEATENILRDMHIEASAFLIFNRAVFQEKNRNDLRNLDLSKCIFRETNLEYCDVSLVQMDWKWRLLNESLNNDEYLRMLHEESPSRFNHAADSYRRLKVYYTERRHYKNAAICHYREWECRRKAHNWKNPKEFFSLIVYWCLRLSSRYGERMDNVVFTIAAILLFCPFLFTFPGFQLCPDIANFTAQSGIDQWWGESVITHWWWGFKHTFFNFFPLWRLDDVRVCTDPARLATGLIALTGAFMIGMFIYVFRRRLMR